MNLLLVEDRKKLVARVMSESNKARKNCSKRQCDIYNGHLKKYIKEYLSSVYSSKNVASMPIICSMNFTKRIIDDKAKLYANGPERSFEDVSDTEVIEQIYKDLDLDTALNKSHRLLELQQQTLLQILPKKGRITTRILKPHQFDLIPSDEDPEEIEAVVISSFDQEYYERESLVAKKDNNSKKMGDVSLESMRFTVWTKEYNFIINGKGDLVTEPDQIGSPVPGILPFVDIFKDKDFNIYADPKECLTDFTVEYNSQLTVQAETVKFQSFAQPFFKGPSELLKKDIVLGPDKIVKLPTDDFAGNDQVEFGYVSPNTDLEGVRKHLESMLNDFLTTVKIDKRSFTEGSKSFSSGVERMLSMVEDFEKSREVISIFERVESEIYSIIKAWHNALRGSDLIESKYQGAELSQDSYIRVEFKKPEMMQTDMELAQFVKFLEDSNYINKEKALEKLFNLTEEEAANYLLELGNEDDPIQEELQDRPELPDNTGASERPVSESAS